MKIIRLHCFSEKKSTSNIVMTKFIYQSSWSSLSLSPHQHQNLWKSLYHPFGSGGSITSWLSNCTDISTFRFWRRHRCRHVLSLSIKTLSELMVALGHIHDIYIVHLNDAACWRTWICKTGNSRARFSKHCAWFVWEGWRKRKCGNVKNRNLCDMTWIRIKLKCQEIFKKSWKPSHSAHNPFFHWVSLLAGTVVPEFIL